MPNFHRGISFEVVLWINGIDRMQNKNKHKSEEELLDEWISDSGFSSDESDLFFGDLKNIDKLNDRQKLLSSFDTEKALEKVLSRIRTDKGKES